ncbi:acyl-CoA oxidase [Ascoidea rubescens DSM 1968]|uniref:Acyl-coenzyme A oxidase n=1 Tax=Ascoidea rubescens DSM 1968 TaxID=1344418 RepID=A0A1D2VH37_9ASCO|nr:acyl-CoA oxidase [Ascoidea rubescens DSM 1968]ODV60981.1 acyl-CoA oxidase [Ascoidea rubescens DSM 1968]
MSRTEFGNIPNPSNIINNERNRFTDFNIDELFTFIEGNTSKDSTETLKLMQELERDLILNNDQLNHYDNLSKNDIRKTTFLKIKQLSNYLENDIVFSQKSNQQLSKDGSGKAAFNPYNIDLSNFNKRLLLIGVHDPQLGTRLGVHLGLFLNAIKGTGTQSQFNYWAFERGALSVRNIYGCFAMTELAHGSNVAGVETTATYNSSDQSFVVNTPHLGATKWWIGGAASSANHCVAYCRLIVDGKDYGVKTFVVPLRDSNHNLFPGIAIGDIGAKMGRDGIDNGWIQFTNVKIPKNFMLQKYCKIVDKKDKSIVIDPPLAQLAYSALLDGRMNMVIESFRHGARFIIIALRYAVGRRQFGKSTNPDLNYSNEFEKKKSASNNIVLEKQLIDYPHHQYRLIPLLATIYAISCASDKLRINHTNVNNNLDKLSQDPALMSDEKFLFTSINDLKALFVQSASLKSTCTWFTANLIDECRQACGGHGYSAYAGFGKGYNDWVVQCTWEGDNNILATSAGKSIIKFAQKILAKKFKAVPKDFGYLIDAFNSKDSNDNNDDDFDVNDYNSHLKLIGSVIFNLAKSCNDILSTNNNNWDIITTECVKLSKFNAYYYLLNSFIEYFNKPNTGKSVKKVLQSLILLLSNYFIYENSNYFLQFNILDSEKITRLKLNIMTVLLPYLRQRVIGLTDSFKYSDFLVQSVLGNYNGDIYNNYFDLVNKISNHKLEYNKTSYDGEVLQTLKREDVSVREFNEKDELALKKLGE